MANAIPVQNVYYLLCYAWDQLDQGNLIDVDSLPSIELADLFARVLCDGVEHLAKRGLEQGYELVEEEIVGVRGKINFGASTRRSLFYLGRAHCEFDELTSNTLANRIIKSTLFHFLRVDELNAELKKRIRYLVRRLPRIEPIEMKASTFRAVHIHGNNRFYRFLLNVCELVYSSLLIDERSGTTRFRDFVRDDKQMANLFEAFVRNFAIRECPQWNNRRRENVPWQALSVTDSELSLLPRMQTDISLSQPGRYLIVDTKYYREALRTNYDVEKFRNENLYQLLSYILNSAPRAGASAQGMLLYPRVDRTLREQYEILGRQISICTVDLAQPWSQIDRELRELFR